MAVYYNEHDPFAGAWLRELITAGLIADGEVDTRSIVDVQPSDLAGFVQCHFFAGIGGWSYALRLAGWPDDRPVWTGSCPCQPFSAAGSNAGGNDPRHLWPAWYRLIRECRPPVVFGEQVEAAVGHGWLDLVCDDLEREGYACGAVGLPAASVGAPHIRQRLWFVAESNGRDAEHRTLQRSGQHGLRAEGRCTDGHAGDTERPEDGDVEQLADASDAYGGSRERRAETTTGTHGERRGRSPSGSTVSSVADADGERRTGERLLLRPEETGRDASDLPEVARRSIDQLGDSEQYGPQGGADSAIQRARRRDEGSAVGLPSGSPWADLIWLPCRDGNARPTQPSIQPLVAGLPRGVVPSGDPGLPEYANATAEARAMRLRGYGNAIVPQVAAEVIRAYSARAILAEVRRTAPKEER